MTTLTWHQKRGRERALGLHRWIGQDDTADACLSCGTVAEHRCPDPYLQDPDHEEHEPKCYDRCTTPMVCGPNDARLRDEHRDRDYVPHHWMATGDDTSECVHCGQETDGSANVADTPYDERPSCVTT